jgi:hypothetical protein
VTRAVTRGWALSVVAAVFISGCYESDVPLDPTPQIGIDLALLGTWRCLPLGAGAEEKPATVVVTSDGPRQYGVTWREGEADPERYRAYLSSVRVPRLLNVQCLKEGKTEKTWEFIRYSLLRPDVLYLQVVSDDALKDTEKSPMALRRAVERLHKQPTLYVDFCACVRARQGS